MPDSGSLNLIDVHAHYLPPGYREQVAAGCNGPPDGIPRMPDWEAANTLAVMDRVGIATAMLSVSSPGVNFGDHASARRLARSVNEFARRTADDHPGRFGLFASLPLPDVDGALGEIGYAFDVLKADGVVMLTNAGGIYLGDARFDPIFDELNRRHAVIFIHPTSPPCWESIALGYPRPMLEFMFDSTRAVVNLILGGTMERCPDLKVIVPHAGGTLPFLARRIAALTSMFLDSARATPAGVTNYLRRFYYDLAGSTGDNALAPLLMLAERSRILYGSDYPFTPEQAVNAHLKEMAESAILKPGDMRAIGGDNALRLFPRLQAR